MKKKALIFVTPMRPREAEQELDGELDGTLIPKGNSSVEVAVLQNTKYNNKKMQLKI